MKAIILAGGKGTRLREVIQDIPKPMALVDGKPFLEYLILQLKKWKVDEVVLSVGYKREIIKNYFGNGNKLGLSITYSEENEPLGTGGALKKAASMIQESHFIVMNGDSICPVDFHQFYTFHIQKGGILSMVITRPLPENSYGVVEVNSENRILAFLEKVNSRKESFINAGIYIAERRIFDHMPAKNSFSLEYDLFPKILPLGCYGLQTVSQVIDIGTPERYVKALRKLSNISSQ